jgi:hypothetical protein
MKTMKATTSAAADRIERCAPRNGRIFTNADVRSWFPKYDFAGADEIQAKAIKAALAFLVERLVITRLKRNQFVLNDKNCYCPHIDDEVTS